MVICGTKLRLRHGIKWLLITYFILWVIVFVMSFNIVIMLNLWHYLIRYGFYSIITLQLMILIIAVLIPRVVGLKSSSMAYLVLWMTSLITVFSSSLYLSIIWNIVGFELFMSVITYSTIFSTAFSATFIAISLFTWYRKCKSVKSCVDGL